MKFDILIATYDNEQMLINTMRSIMANTIHLDIELNFIIANNSQTAFIDLKETDNIKIINLPENRGWEGGIEACLEYSTSEYLLISNDDIFIPKVSELWLHNAIDEFNKNPKLAIVGYESNFVAGIQLMTSIVSDIHKMLSVRWLISYFWIFRKSAFQAIGFFNKKMPMNHGDDIDISIRMKLAGYELLCDKSIYIHHYGSVVGNKITNGNWYPASKTNLIREKLTEFYGSEIVNLTYNNQIIDNYEY